MDRRPCVDCKKPLSAQRAKTRKRRCHSCEVAAARAAKDRAHDAYVCKTYGLRPGDYQRLYEAQGGRCFICRLATGATRRLAVDHDHSCCKTVPTCGQCTRGLLCKPCNRMLGLARDAVEFFLRAAEYLTNPPARKILGIRKGDA